MCLFFFFFKYIYIEGDSFPGPQKPFSKVKGFIHAEDIQKQGVANLIENPGIHGKSLSFHTLFPRRLCSKPQTFLFKLFLKPGTV